MLEDETRQEKLYTTYYVGQDSAWQSADRTKPPIYYLNTDRVKTALLLVRPDTTYVVTDAHALWLDARYSANQ